MNRFNWIQRKDVDPDVVTELSSRLDVPLAGARFLAARELTDLGVAEHYLDPSPGDIGDPFAFENMERAVELVAAAIKDGKSVLVHGDYDVDGISGTALLYHYFDGLFEKIYRFVPDRRKDGYGVAERSIEWALSKKVGLFIAVDCGTSDGELLGRLEAAGIDVIVCDHHEFPVDGKYAGVMLNPTREGERYPFRSLCGAGVAYKLVQALDARNIRGKSRPEDLLDLVALATVGDLASLVGENRYYVRAGLNLMNEAPRPAVEAMRGFARIGNRQITSHHIAFGLAPRINAPGRVSRPKPSLEILCENNKSRARELASQLEVDNDRRKELTRIVQDEAVARIRALADREQRGGFVIAGEGWDEGVLGIAAARVVEEFGRPAVLMTVLGDIAKGSGRSIPGVHLKEHLDRLEDCFVRYGGHSQAVGLTIETRNLERFENGLTGNLTESVSAEQWRPLKTDADIEIEECTPELLTFISRCEPFGNGNKQPVWRISDVQVMRETTFVGNNHLKLYFQDTRGVPGEAIKFGWDRDETPDDLHGRVIDLAVNIKQGEYMGRRFPELRIVDIRFHGS